MPASFQDMPRSTSRVIWRAIYRLARISIRESAKAASDAMIYGVGFVHFGDEPRHVPTGEIVAVKE